MTDQFSESEDLDFEEQRALFQPPPGGRPIMTPLSQFGWPLWLVYLLGVAAVIYVLNLGSGQFEAIRDNVPFIGNLDEGLAYLFIWSALIEFLEGRRMRNLRRMQM